MSFLYFLRAPKPFPIAVTYLTLDTIKAVLSASNPTPAINTGEKSCLMLVRNLEGVIYVR